LRRWFGRAAGGGGATDPGDGVLPFTSAAFGPREVDARSSGAKRKGVPGAV
jgi:hypothetical protein